MAAAKGQGSMRREVKSVIEGDLIDLSDKGSDDDTEVGDSSARDLEELVPRSGPLRIPHSRSPTMETLTEENERDSQDDSPRSRRTIVDHRSEELNPGFSHRVNGPVRTHLYPPANNRGATQTPTLANASSNATIDSQSVKSTETRYSLWTVRALNCALILFQEFRRVVVVRKSPFSGHSADRCFIRRS